jgi:ascorbate-specific PTS system EIIC-type component UlaA
MSKQTKAALATIGIIAVGDITGTVLGFDHNAVTYGFIVGTICSNIYTRIKGS